MGAGVLEGTVKSELQVAVFSGIKLGWEPLLEPWHCRLKFATPTSVPPVQHQRLAVSSVQGLELTLTQAAVEAAALAGGALQAAAAVASDPSSLEAQLEAAGSSAAYSAAFWLHNQTGSTLELWLAGSEDDGGFTRGQPSTIGLGGSEDGGSASPATARSSSWRGSRVPSCLPELVVRPGGRVVLPVVASSEQQQGLHAGSPCPLEGVARQRRHSGGLHASSSKAGLAAAGGASATPRLPEGGSSSSLGTSRGTAAAQSRPLLYFRLTEQAEICGPLHLDR
jgi:hypothetical protein